MPCRRRSGACDLTCVAVGLPSDTRRGVGGTAAAAKAVCHSFLQSRTGRAFAFARHSHGTALHGQCCMAPAGYLESARALAGYLESARALACADGYLESARALACADGYLESARALACADGYLESARALACADGYLESARALACADGYLESARALACADMRRVSRLYPPPPAGATAASRSDYPPAKRRTRHNRFICGRAQPLVRRRCFAFENRPATARGSNGEALSVVAQGQGGGGEGNCIVMTVLQ